MNPMNTVRCALVAFAAAASAVGALEAPADYRFEISYFQANPDNHHRAWVQGINKSMPGPVIYVRQHQRLALTLVNQMATEEVAIHWHGFEMRNAQEFDGAAGITQCGIKPGGTHTFSFEVDEHPGTYYYHEHAHLEHVAARGLYGAIVVLPPAGAPELHAADRDEVLMLSDWYPYSPHELERQKQARLVSTGSVSVDGNAVGLLPFYNMLINGRGGFDVFARGSVPTLSKLHHITPRAGETWRLRLVNAGALYAMTFRIDGHRLRVIQADAADVVPYDCDAVMMSAGERFDVLVTFNQPQGSYWIRVETLENQPFVHHGQLGVVRYAGTAAAERPAGPVSQRLRDVPGLVILNCMDLGPISPTCRPITDLRRLVPGQLPEDATHDFEVSMRGFAGKSSAHFTRLLDLGVGSSASNTFGSVGNTLGENQHGGEFVQVRMPHLPYSYWGNESADHPNTLSMRVGLGENVRVVLQLQDRTAHPWHLHGHKFSVLGVGFPEYDSTCDVLYCRSAENHWLTRDGLAKDGFQDVRLLSPAEAPLKDTVHVPAGGWAVIQFRADNPGWWLFHCHMQVHLHDGMGLVLIEGEGNVPQRLFNRSYLDAALPTCREELETREAESASGELGEHGLSCSCWEDPEMMLDQLPRRTYKCAEAYLCAGDDVAINGEPWQIGDRAERIGARGWAFRAPMVATAIVLAIVHLGGKQQLRAARRRRAARLHMAANLVACRGSKAVSRFSVGKRVPSCSTMCGIRFRGCMAVSMKTVKITGELPPGSVCAIMGDAEQCKAWLGFLTGSPAHTDDVEGWVEIAGRPLEKWMGATGTGNAVPLRPHSTVAETLELRIQLTSASGIYTTPKEREEFLTELIDLFDLKGILHKEMQNLSDAEMAAVCNAEALSMPRAVVGLDTLRSLKPAAMEHALQCLAAAAARMGTALLISVPGQVLPPGAGLSVSHMMLLAEYPVFGSCDKVQRTVEMGGLEAPEGSDFVTWISECMARGLEAQEAARDAEYASEEPSGHSWAALTRRTVRGRTVKRQTMAQPMPALIGGDTRSRKTMVAPPSYVISSAQSIRRSAGDPGRTRQWGGWQRRGLLRQLLLLLRYQFVCEVEEYSTPYRAVQMLCLGFLSGLVWWGKGELHHQTALGECVGLLFFASAFFTVPVTFQALARAPNVSRVFMEECGIGLYGVVVGIVVKMTLTFLLLVTWIPMWQTIAFSFAGLGRSPVSVLNTNIVLSMNALAMTTLGLALDSVCPMPTTNVVIADILAQFAMLTNGFYTTLPGWLGWVTTCSVPRYTFRALLKLEFSWRDSFEVHPLHGVSAFGSGSRFVPAELTTVFQLMRVRNMKVMQSPVDASIFDEVMTLLGIAILFGVAFAFAIRMKLNSLCLAGLACRCRFEERLPTDSKQREEEEAVDEREKTEETRLDTVGEGHSEGSEDETETDTEQGKDEKEDVEQCQDLESEVRSVRSL